MGIFQPGGAGTQIHVYDDANNTNHPAAPGPHTWAEINTAFPVDFAILQTAAAGVFSATHRQYLCVVDLMLGNPAGGNANATSLVDTTGADIFSPNGTGGVSRLRTTTANVATAQTLTIGTKIGTGKKTSGCRGGSIHSGTLTWRMNCNLGLYGCFVDGGGSVAIQNGSSPTIEIAGCTFDIVGSYVIGTQAGPFTVYNTTFNSSTTGTFATSFFTSDAYNVVLSAPTPSVFYVSAAPQRQFRRITLNGAVTQGDLRFSVGSFGNVGVDLIWSDTAGKPRIISSGPSGPFGSFDDYRSFDTKVVSNPTGDALAGVPVYVEDSVAGAVLDDVTEADGNVVFTNAPISTDGVIKVREYDDPTGSADGSTIVVSDRVFTMWINSYKGSVAPLPNYQTRVVTFEWPGRDRFGTGYLTDGGAFLPVMTIVRLDPGSPSRNPLWTECEVTP